MVATATNIICHNYFGFFFLHFTKNKTNLCFSFNDIKQRITIAEVIENEWFKKGYVPPRFEQANVSLDDVDAIFGDSLVRDLVFVRPY